MRQWLFDIRRVMGKTQKDVAAAARISQPSYNYIERGNRNPSVETAKRIAYILEFDWVRFFEDSEPKQVVGGSTHDN